jgi:hypothetical protein
MKIDISLNGFVIKSVTVKDNDVLALKFKEKE